MEQSRYQENHGLYILGFLALLLGFLFLGIALYLSPLVFFDVNINVPPTYLKFIMWVHERVRIKEAEAIWITWEIFVALGLLFLVTAQIISNFIDNHLLKYKKTVNPELLIEKEKDLVEVKHVVVIVLVAILLAIAALKLFEATIT